MQELPQEKKINPGLKLALELGPIVLFVLCYNRGDWLLANFDFPSYLQKPIFLATVVMIVSTLTAIALSWILTRSLPAMPIVTAVVFHEISNYFGNLF